MELGISQITNDFNYRVFANRSTAHPAKKLLKALLARLNLLGIGRKNAGKVKLEYRARCKEQTWQQNNENVFFIHSRPITIDTAAFLSGLS